MSRFLLKWSSRLLRLAAGFIRQLLCEKETAMQRVTDVRIDRSYHVWHQREDDSFKCVICGGISFEPTEICDCVRYERLTEEERRMCPQRESKSVPPAEERGKVDRREEQRGKKRK